MKSSTLTLFSNKAEEKYSHDALIPDPREKELTPQQCKILAEKRENILKILQEQEEENSSSLQNIYPNTATSSDPVTCFTELSTEDLIKDLCLYQNLYLKSLSVSTNTTSSKNSKYSS